MDPAQIERNLEAALEDLQEAIVLAGGCFMRRARLRNMTVGELLGVCLPNGIEVNFEHTH